MKQTMPKTSRWVYLWFMLAVVALLASLVLQMRAQRIAQVESARLSAAQSQQLLAERMLTESAGAADQDGLAQLLSEFEQLQQQGDAVGDTLLYRANAANPALQQSREQTAEAWALFRQNLPDPARQDTASSRESASGPDFQPLQELTRTLAEWLAGNSAAPEHLESASHLEQLAAAIDARTTVDESGAPQTTAARGAWLFFDQILNSLEVAVQDGELDAQGSGALLTELRSEITELDHLFAGADGVSGGAAAATARADQLHSHSLLNIALENQITAIGLAAQSQQLWFRMGLLAALVSVTCLFLGSFALLRSSRRQARHASQNDKENQDSILRLLDEISALAEGDLNTRATVTEDATGAIADAVNYAVTELRRLVSAITSSADRVTVAVEETGSSAQQLAKASSVQSREIQRSTTYLSAMAETMEQMSQRSLEAAQIASQSVEKSVGGRRCVEDTIDVMERIRSQVTQTSTLLARLGESSTQIGEIVNLINEVTGRSRLLALNSAIHSNSEAQDNHRFTSIANEVQTLSATLKEAAGEIETLVNIIQDDTRAATESMNLTTAEVEQGNECVQSAGEALHSIETISRRLSVVVEHLSDKTRKQSDVVNQLSANMGVINDVTRRSAHGMQLSAAALEDLRHMATELRDGVEDFVLPPAGQRFTQQDDIVGRPLLKKRGLSVSATIRTAGPPSADDSLVDDIVEDDLAQDDLTAEHPLDKQPVDEFAETIVDDQGAIRAGSLSVTTRPAVGLVREKMTSVDG